MNNPRKEPDTPFEDDRAIERMVAAFEDRSWPCERWTHRAHVGVAVSYLRRLTFEQALERMRRNINLYNHRCGAPTGYHETVTVLFLRRLAAALDDWPVDAGLAGTVEALASTYDMHWPLNYYSSARLWSPRARREWVEPDLRPLDFWPAKLSGR